MSGPVVVLVAHGTADPSGRAVLDDLRDAVAGRLVGQEVRLAFVDVIDPTPEQVLVGTTGAVLVPLFLASGHHVSVDVPAAVRGAERAVATDPLGADPLVVEAIGDRVREVAASPAAVVLAAAGSSRAEARAEVALAADRLAHRLGCPVTAAFLGGPGTTVPDALAALITGQSDLVPTKFAKATTEMAMAAQDSSAVVVAAHLLAPGHFHDKAAGVAAEHGVRCTEPIGVHPRIVDLVVRLATSAAVPTLPTAEEPRS